VWIVLALLSIFAAGCPAPPKPQVIEKPPEAPLLYRLLTGTDQKQLFDYLKPVLGNFGIEFDSTLQFKKSQDNPLPKYEPAVNTVFLPEDSSGESFLRAAADAVGVSSSDVGSSFPEEARKDELLNFIHNVFLFNKLAVYARHQSKIFNYVNPFEEEEISQEFARVLVSHFSAEEPTVAPLAEGLAAFYEKLLAHAPKEFPGLSTDSASLREWFNKNHTRLTTTSQSSLLLYRMVRQLAHFKKEQAPALAEFVKTNIIEPRDRTRRNITVADKPLSAHTIYKGKARPFRRVGHSYQFRGLSGIAAGLGGRVFFSDYRDIQQVARSGSRDVVEGSQGVFAPTGFCADSQGRFYFVDRDMVRVVDLPGRSVSNIVIGDRLKGSAAADPHGIVPIAINSDGRLLVVNNSTRTLYMLEGDGSLLESATLLGVTGGIAFAGGHVYVTNTTHHTVDRVDFGSGTATVAGVRDYPGHGDGKGFEVFFNSPTGICVNDDGVAFVADTYNHAIRRIDTDGSVSTVVGIERGSEDNTAQKAKLHCPVGIAVGNDGTLYVVELSSERVVMISPARKQVECKAVPATGVSGLDSEDRKICELSKTIKQSAVGYKLFDTYTRRGVRHRELEDYDKSTADLQTAMKIAPEKLSAYVEAGLTKEAAGQMDAAIAVYTLAIEKKKDLVPVERFRDHDFLRVLMQRGLAQASQANFSSAIEDLSNVINLRKMAVQTFKEPDLPREKLAHMWFTRGKIYLESGQPEKAISDFKQALVQDSKMVKAYYYRGVAYKSSGKHELAVKDLKRAASLDAPYAEPHYILGLIYQENIVDNHKALQHLRTYLALKGANKADAEVRIEELKKKMDRTTVSEEPYWEEIIEDNEGRRWILRHYASGKTQKFAVKEEEEK
jgi:tetratricopeptide (TPR) repeat protein